MNGMGSVGSFLLIVNEHGTGWWLHYCKYLEQHYRFNLLFSYVQYLEQRFESKVVRLLGCFLFIIKSVSQDYPCNLNLSFPFILLLYECPSVSAAGLRQFHLRYLSLQVLGMGIVLFGPSVALNAGTHDMFHLHSIGAEAVEVDHNHALCTVVSHLL